MTFIDQCVEIDLFWFEHLIWETLIRSAVLIEELHQSILIKSKSMHNYILDTNSVEGAEVPVQILVSYSSENGKWKLKEMICLHNPRYQIRLMLEHDMCSVLSPEKYRINHNQTAGLCFCDFHLQRQILLVCFILKYCWCALSEACSSLSFFCSCISSVRLRHNLEMQDAYPSPILKLLAIIATCFLALLFLHTGLCLFDSNNVVQFIENWLATYANLWLR